MTLSHTNLRSTAASILFACATIGPAITTHSQEPLDPTPTPTPAHPYAVEVVAATGPFGPAPYDDPASVLGMPSTRFHDPWGGMSGGTTERRVKLVEAPYNLDPSRTRKLLTTLDAGSSIVVRFQQPITNHPAHPFGIDFLVFGNAFYPARGAANDAADLNSLMLASGALLEPLKVSVSPGPTGAPGQDPSNPTSWEWYRFDNGPFADTAFPTHAYRWSRSLSTWTDALMDFTKPVNPAFRSTLESGGLSAADALDFYDGSGGGTGFDIAESGFASIQYVRLEASPGFDAGEIDALAAVRPAILGDSLTLAASSDSASTPPTLRFQFPDHPQLTAVALTFTHLTDHARITTSPQPSQPPLPSTFGRLIIASLLAASPILGSNSPVFLADLTVGTGADYSGDGSDLALLREGPQGWEHLPATFDPSSRALTSHSLTNLAPIALIQMLPPRIHLGQPSRPSTTQGLTVRFAALPGFIYTLERSPAPDFAHTTEVANTSPALAHEASLSDNTPDASAFYRVRVHQR